MNKRIDVVLAIPYFVDCMDVITLGGLGGQVTFSRKDIDSWKIEYVT